jgi:hypothetical protein
MCEFTCSMFGAAYEDGTCIEGYMWDLDSCDGDRMLTSGGEIPCPKCNTAAYLQDQAERASDDCPNPGTPSPAQFWEGTIRICLDLNPEVTQQTLRAMKPFEMADWPGRIDTPERHDPDWPDDIILRQWPWPVPDISQHAQIAIHPR